MRDFFEGTRPGRAVTAGSVGLELPALYFREDSFLGMFTADLANVRRLMPSRSLHPVRTATGRALLAIAAYDYLETSFDPYGEVAIAVPVVHGRRAAPVLPLLAEARWGGFGYLVLHLPVTRRSARDGGREVWGYAKFIADMKFRNTPERYECRLDEGGDHILTLRVVKRGLLSPDRRPIVTYSVKDRALVRTTVPQTAITRTALGAGGSSLELGDAHPVARSLRELDVDPRPVATRYFLDRQAILPEGEVVERGVQPLDGYRGSELEEGELVSVHA